MQLYYSYCLRYSLESGGGAVIVIVIVNNFCQVVVDVVEVRRTDEWNNFSPIRLSVTSPARCEFSACRVALRWTDEWNIFLQFVCLSLLVLLDIAACQIRCTLLRLT